MLRHFLAFALLLGILFCGNVAGQAQPFSKDDRVCFLGDSIFHGGKVHSNLLLFYATRYPDARLSFHNAGVAGDMASEAPRRLDWDVKPFAPTFTVIMFGMNDVGRWYYGEGKDTPSNFEQRERQIDTSIQASARLRQALANTRLILCTPTPFDQTTQRPTANAMGVDDALAVVAQNIRDAARAGGHGLVDFHAEMNRVIEQQQAKDPAFTMMDGQRVHPDDAGHLLMSYLFLKAQGISPTVARIAIDAAKPAAIESVNCKLTDIRKDGNRLSFTYHAGSLPFPVQGNAAAALKWVPFTDELNQEMLIVKSLPAGTYELAIDGQSVGKWTSEEFARGVNLATNPKTPQYRQALAMADLNEKRRSRETSTLRVFAALEHDLLRRKNVDLSDMAAVKQVLDQAIEEEGRNKTWRHSYFINLAKAYVPEKPNQAAITKELATLTAKLFEMAKPNPHEFQLAPVTP